jgi:hypothetical protein
MKVVDRTDEELLEEFESCTVPGEEFRHREHVRVAFLYLNRYPLLDALRRFSTALARYAASMGKAQRYHETITWAYMFLVNERREPSQDWEEFCKANPDLLDWKNSILARYYNRETLGSEQARRKFIMTDRRFGV